MKAIKIFENASVVSVFNGTITLDTEMGRVCYKNASLSSVHDGTIKIIVDKQELEMNDLQTGMVVQYGTGEYRLVIRLSDEWVKLVELKNGGFANIRVGHEELLRCIARVWEPIVDGSIDEWMKIDSSRKVIFER